MGLHHFRPQLFLDILSVKMTIIGVFCLPVTFFMARGLYNLFLSPLRSIPGPWYAAFSNIWILAHTFACRKVRAIDDLFSRYGPVVRIAPNTVAFLDDKTSRYVYNGLKLDKGPLYDAVHMNGHLHSVAIIEHSVHAKYRRIFSSHYTPGNIALIHPEMKTCAQTLIDKISEMKDRPVDIFVGMHLVMIDLILQSTFGQHQDALSEWTEDTHNEILSLIEDYGRLILLGGITPDWIMSILKIIPNKRFRRFLASGDNLFQAITNLVHEFLAAKKAGRLDEGEKPTLIERFLKHNALCAPEDVLDDEAMVSESMTHLLAGVDASAVVQSYILWQFAQQPEHVKAKIHHELDEAMPDPRVIPDLKALQSLPMLDSLIKEGLRLHGPIPTFLERLAPKGDALDVMGYKLPQGTIVGTQSWSVHRQGAVYSNPEDFDALRWVNADQAQESSLIPFGLGTRVCVGQHLARNAVRTMTAAMIRNFEILPCTETNTSSMKMIELFGMFPVGLSCKLNFKART